ncbi:MAG: hypothetical protein LBF81_07540 [Prevotellaceae bacterium]|jgi:hypothetical protein|nr:hypothetical protein [Prevotellaceae bacterium]
MKKIIFLFAMLAGSAASATVTVTPLDVNYNTKTVTFSVSWTGSAANNRVWVWIDLCPVSGTSPGTFAKAELSSPSVTAGSIAEFNQRGFYVNANPTTVTAVLDNATGEFNWCAYGSDFPPNAKDNSSGGYDLKGSPPFIINGTIEWTANTYSGTEITALTDATGCPGVWCGRDGETVGLLNCCSTGLTNCDGSCKSNCGPVFDKACGNSPDQQWVWYENSPPYSGSLFSWCRQHATALGYGRYYYTYSYGDDAWSVWCGIFDGPIK